MYKTLNPQVLGISGRQSEIIELALTYGFRGMEIDTNEFAKRVELRGLDRAKRFLESGHLKVSGFELPMKWRGDESVYESELEKLEQIAGYAAALGVKGCHTPIMPATDMFPYHENFELHRKRLGAIADALAKHGIRLGVSFFATASHRAGKDYQFIHEADALVTLIKSVASKNIGLMLDTWNWHFGGGKLEQVRALRSRSHRFGAHGRGTGRSNDRDGDGRTTIDPGDVGTVDNAAIIGVLSEIGYKGPVSADPHPATLGGMTRDVIVQKCSQALDELLKTVGITRCAGRWRVQVLLRSDCNLLLLHAEHDGCRQNAIKNANPRMQSANSKCTLASN